MTEVASLAHDPFGPSPARDAQVSPNRDALVTRALCRLVGAEGPYPYPDNSVIVVGGSCG